MSTETIASGRGPSRGARVAIGLVTLVVSVVIVLLGVWLFAGELAPGGEAGSIAIMGVWFLVAIGIGAWIAWRVRSLAVPLAVGILGTAGVVTGVLAYTAFTDRVVNEQVAVAGEPARATGAEDAAAAPAEEEAAPPPADDPTPAPAPAVNVALAEGGFSGLAHPTTGTATALDLADGGRALTLTDFETDNGPDLFVYLVAGEVNSNGDGDDFVDLGSLKGNIGNQQYAIPDGVDLDRYSSVVIWCRAFSVGFGVAELAPA